MKQIEECGIGVHPIISSPLSKSSYLLWVFAINVWDWLITIHGGFRFIGVGICCKEPWKYCHKVGIKKANWNTFLKKNNFNYISLSKCFKVPSAQCFSLQNGDNTNVKSFLWELNELMTWKRACIVTQCSVEDLNKCGLDFLGSGDFSHPF